MAASHPSLGNVIEICIATPDHRRSIRELSQFGIGPWKVYTFDTRSNVSNGTIAGRPAHFRLRVAFAQLTDRIAYEVIEPLDQDTSAEIFSTWLTARSERAGIHHIAYDCHNIPWADRLKKFNEMGAIFTQGGTWHGKKGTCNFAWFRASQIEETEAGEHAQGVGATSTFFETIEFSNDWEDPEPDITL